MYIKKALTLAATTCLLHAPSLSFATQITYQLTPKNTLVNFQVPFLGVFSIKGRIPASGTLVVDTQNFSDSTATVTLYTQQLTTGHPQVDLILKGRYFFDTQHYPFATFTSYQMTLNKMGQGAVNGRLSIKNHSRPITIHIVLSPAPATRGKPAQTMHITAQTQIQRDQFGMTSYRPAVSNSVTINIQANAISN